MASRLQKIREYWQTTADTHFKLVEPKPKPKAVVIQYVARKPTEKKIESAELIYERAYILASDMNLPLKWAEAVVKLCSINKPKMIPQSSWLEVEAACSQLYMDDFALLKLIINNNWSLEDIYGCNNLAPLVRVDCMGLVLLLHQGDEVVGVNKESIKILKKSGSKVAFSKRLDQQVKTEMLYDL